MTTQNEYMLKTLIDSVDKDCKHLQKANDQSLEALYLKAIALIIVGRLRCFLRGKTPIEIYKLTKEIKSLSKVRAAERHQLVNIIFEFI